MKTSTMVQKFCKQNGRGFLTPAERQKLTAIDAEIARVLGHTERYAVGKARRDLVAARGAYGDNPTEENRANLDNIQATWLETDKENQAQRSIINRALIRLATDGLKGLLPPLLLRAANALAWLSVELRFEEEKKHAEFEVPYTPGAIVNAFKFEITRLRHAARQIGDRIWTASHLSHSVTACEFLPAVAHIEGDPWNGDTLDPQTLRGSGKWRNFGQSGDPLFQPLLCELDGTAAASEKGKSVKKYPALAIVAALVAPLVPA